MSYNNYRIFNNSVYIRENYVLYLVDETTKTIKQVRFVKTFNTFRKKIYSLNNKYNEPFFVMKNYNGYCEVFKDYEHLRLFMAHIWPKNGDRLLFKKMANNGEEFDFRTAFDHIPLTPEESFEPIRNDLRKYFEKPAKPVIYKDGEPCSHPGCFVHLSHPCEVCGRIVGFPIDTSR